MSLYMRSILWDLGVPQEAATILYDDNTGTTAMANAGKPTPLSCHIDITYYVLKALSWIGVTWDLGEPPREVVRNERRVGTAVLERVSRQMAEQYAAKRASSLAAFQHAREAFDAHPKVIEMRARLAANQFHAQAGTGAITAPAFDVDGNGAFIFDTTGGDLYFVQAGATFR